MNIRARDLVTIVLLGAGAGAGAARAEEPLETAPVHRPAGDVVFSAVVDLKQKGLDFAPQLRGGQDAVPAEWPASLYVTFATPDGPRACTAALIGPEVMLTAAHCVPLKGEVRFAYDGQARPYITTCVENPAYKTDISADYALCRLDRPFTPPANFRYEKVRIATMDTAVGKQNYVLLTGYGCKSDQVAETDIVDGKYQIGYALVDESSNSASKTRGAQYYVDSQRNNLFTFDDGVGSFANLCPGDSGGPAFVLTGGPGKVHLNRAIVGVNSRVFYNRTKTRYSGSLVSATGAPDFQTWAVDWLDAQSLSACGLRAGPMPCR